SKLDQPGASVGVLGNRCSCGNVPVEEQRVPRGHPDTETRMMRLDGDTDAHGSAEEIPFAHTDLRSVGRPHAHLGGRTPDVARPNRHVDSTATSAFTPLDAHVAEERE